jgi:hypothetical protein
MLFGIEKASNPAAAEGGDHAERGEASERPLITELINRL